MPRWTPICRKQKTKSAGQELTTAEMLALAPTVAKKICTRHGWDRELPHNQEASQEPRTCLDPSRAQLEEPNSDRQRISRGCRVCSLRLTGTLALD